MIDLSALTHEAKQAYVHELLPMLANLRRNSGLPHWIVVDEAHYFLNQPDVGRRVDFELAAYVLITYRPSHLHPELLSTTGTIIATPLTDPDEVLALTTLCGAEGAESAWGEILGGLGIDERRSCPRCGRWPFCRNDSRSRPPDGACPAPGKISRSAHACRARFHFTCNGQNFGTPARTLKEFVRMQERLPAEALAGHAQRG